MYIADFKSTEKKYQLFCDNFTIMYILTMSLSVSLFLSLCLCLFLSLFFFLGKSDVITNPMLRAKWQIMDTSYTVRLRIPPIPLLDLMILFIVK